jgi:hypothetical protein
MGCDIHVNFETRDAYGKWALTFKRVPDKHYWWETIIDRKVEDGTGAVMTGSSDEKEQYAYLEEHFKSLAEEEIIERYGDHPAMTWDQNMPSLDTTREYSYPEIRHRDYDFFEKIGGVRGDRALFPIQKGVPEDSCQEIKDDVQRWAGDGHSHSWLMVSEMINHRKLTGIKVKWMKTFIADPENTRMVFFFDN